MMDGPPDDELSCEDCGKEDRAIDDVTERATQALSVPIPFPLSRLCCIISLLSGRPSHRFFYVFLSLFACWNALGFVFYQEGSQILKWSLAGSAAHTNVFNPATKAIRYYIASDGYSVGNRAAEIAAVQACFDQWQSVSNSVLKFEFAGFVSPEGLDVRKDDTNVVFWTRNARVDAGGMDISQLRAWTSVRYQPASMQIVEADIVLNAQFQWFTDFNNTVRQAQFVESVLLHEIGHMIGLDHAVAGGTSLAIGANGISPEAGLSEDEIAALRFLYPAPTTVFGKIDGTVRLNGAGILGAVVTAEDANGNLAGATVTRANGSYDIAGLRAGTYSVRVSPLDPANSGTEKLMRGADVAIDYASAVTGFSATTNVAVSVGAGGTAPRDFNVSSGPAMRITSLSRPATVQNLISVHRFAVSLPRRNETMFVAVNGATLKDGSVLSISGDGIIMGPTTFLPNRVGSGTIHSLVASVIVTDAATPGLRSFVVRHGNDVAYANGYLEIPPAVTDYNFDGLDDYFQRRYWSPWTQAAAGPVADPDQDNFSNAFEARMETNPINAQSFRLPISGVTRDGDATRVTVQTDIGKRYQLYERTAFDAGTWEAVGRSLTATGTELTFSDGSALGASFYRVALLP